MLPKRHPIRNIHRIIGLCLTITVAAGVAWLPGDSTAVEAENSARTPERRRRFGWGHGFRLPDQIGKNHELVHQAFSPVVKSANRFTVRIMQENRQVGFGTIVDASGLVLTKASELPVKTVCRVPTIGEFSATSVVTNDLLDLAILRLKDCDRTLPTIDWKAPVKPVRVGSWVAVPTGFGATPLVVGVVSARERDIVRDSAVLGIMIEDGRDGVVVVRVIPSSGADLAGVSNGDVVTRVNETAIRRRRELIREVRKYTPGQSIRLQLRRGERSLTVQPTLGRNQQVALAESGAVEPNEGHLSERRSGFPRVIQHDCLLQAYHCGGPLVNLDGQVIGFNIARAGRVTTYAIAKSAVADSVQAMIARAKDTEREGPNR